MSTITEKRASLVQVNREIAEKEREIRNFSYESDEKDYDAFLDGCYGDVEICGNTYSASYALKEVDPTAYRVGKSDHDGNMDLDDVPEYKELTEELEELENKRDDLESEIEELEEADDENN